MRLTELSPTFLKWTDDAHFQMTDIKGEADGVKFLCPVCFQSNGGPRGTHIIICWQPSVPQTTSPTPGRWEMHGADYTDLTLVAGSSSILLPEAPCHAHFYLRNGEIIPC